MIKFIKKHRKQMIIILVFIAIIAALILIPTGFEKQLYVNAEGVKSEVISVNNDSVHSTGLIKQGEQVCTIKILEGSHAGETVEAVNLLQGKMEFDKIFKPGDMGFALLERDQENKIYFANMVDHYRVDAEIILVAVFAAAIVLLSGFTGIRTLLSFTFSLVCIWQVLVPSLLKGLPPVPVALVIGNVLTIVTLLLVAGFTRKGYAAILGSMGASLFTCVLALVFSGLLHVQGAVMQWSESLLYAGFENLDLTGIFQAGIYLACSGAILDLAVDISAALDEVEKNCPTISRRELIRSGLTIGKSVVGTQTTTLLFAYMGSYISIMMVYMAQGTPFMSIFNSKSFAAEILQTFVGCLGLVIVSPLTALICGLMYKRKKNAGAALLNDGIQTTEEPVKAE